MRKIIKIAVACTFLLNLAFASTILAAPIDKSNLKEVQTLDGGKSWVGEWNGDDTIIVDSQGNVMTVRDVRETSSSRPTVNPNIIRDRLLAPESIQPEFEVPNESFAALVSAYGHAWSYQAENSSGVNCYAYATKYPYWINPGDGDGVSNQGDAQYYTNVNYTANQVIQDGNTNPLYFKSGWRILSSRTAAVNSDEHRIALRIGWVDTNGNGKVDLPDYLGMGGDLVDYHFMLQNSNGLWSEKHGEQPSQNTAISDPSSIVWNNGPYYNFYTSATVYIAAKVH
ncbi:MULTISPECIES: hypothetical protein [unclassified Paenibacillus]|uniref:hypothetical protein n=1 Tax=unclassified Paenibacillus TaxID=185978 RepID=UPI0004BA722C|nr:MULTISPECIES: hypothetical protein [unclassified Paenibacillus]